MSLTGGLSSSEGNVLVNGRPVCDDHWNQNSASVVCGMLGHGGGGQATTNSYFGLVTADFGMDDVLCEGSEIDILDCPHLTTHNCAPTEGAGVICNTGQW